MDIQSTPVHRSRIEAEKQIFTDAIHAEKTYSNKKKMKNSTNTKIPVIENLPEMFCPSISPRNRQKQTKFKVEQWLDSVHELRRPFEDIDPNTPCTTRSKRVNPKVLESPALKTTYSTRSKKIIAKALNNNNDVIDLVENCDIFQLHKRSHAIKKSPKKIIKVEKKKAAVKTNTGNKNIEELIVINESDSHHSECIEEILESPVDKDRQAWLEVCAAESHSKQKQLDKNEVLRCLQNNIDELRVEISALETQTLRGPIVKSRDGFMLWSHNVLINSLNYEPEKIIGKLKKNSKNTSTVSKQVRLRKKNLKYRKKIIKPLKRRTIIQRKQKKKPKITRSVGVQVDSGCSCSVVTINFSNEKKDLDIITSQEHEISEENSKQVSIIRSVEGRRDSVKSVDSDSAHRVSGSHRVSVQFHATADSLDTDSEEQFHTPRKVRAAVVPNVTRKLSNEEDPSFWEQQYRTPTKGSPTYTLTPPSNSSSNKENYAPLTTPPKEKKEVEKKPKEATKSSARRPLSSLFEAPLAKVHVICSNLQSSQIMMVKYLCKRMNWAFSEEFSSEVTHLVIGTEDNKVARTVKYMCGVAAGCWIVSSLWVEQCIKQDCHLTEESFEVLDWSGEPGPQLSRTATDKLLSRFTLCCLDTVTTIRQDILAWIIEAVGGKSVSVGQLSGSALVGPVIVLHEPGDNDSQLYQEASSWKVSYVIIHYEWLLECVGRYRVLSPDSCLLFPSADNSASPALQWLGDLCNTQQ